MNDAQREKLEREQLELARAKLTDEQRVLLERQCGLLREAETYAVKHEIALADVIYEDRAGPHQKTDLAAVRSNAEREARERDLKEQFAARVLAVKEQADKAVADQALKQTHDASEKQAAETTKQQEKPAQAEAQKTAAPELLQPSVEKSQQTPGSIKAVERSLAEELGQKERMNNADMDRLAGLGPNRNNYQPLSANEIQGRFGNPTMEARYNQQEDRRVQEAKTASSSAGDVSTAAPRKGKETGLMADYVSQKTKDKVNDDLAKEAIQQQWKTAASGMTR